MEALLELQTPQRVAVFLVADDNAAAIVLIRVIKHARDLIEPRGVGGKRDRAHGFGVQQGERAGALVQGQQPAHVGGGAGGATRQRQARRAGEKHKQGGGPNGSRQFQFWHLLRDYSGRRFDT